MTKTRKQVQRARKTNSQVRSAVKAAKADTPPRSRPLGSTQRGTTPPRTGDVTGKRTIDRLGRVTKRQGVANPSSPGNTKLRAEASGRRAKRNVAADRTATRKAAAANAAKTASRKAVGKMAARAVPGLGTALAAIDIAGKVGGPGGKSAGKRVRKNGLSTRKR
jgi:hypothetical protein